jgi:polygalacturonase
MKHLLIVSALLFAGYAFTFPQTANTGKNTVTYWGAKGDGTTDDSKAIQRAIDAAKGTLFFPPGAYLIRKGLVVNSDNIVLMGSGKNTASIIVSACNENILTINGFQNSVNGLAIDGNGNSKSGKGYNLKGSGIVVNGNANEVIECVVQNCAGNGIVAEYPNHGKNIMRCKVYTCKGAGIISTCNDLYIRDCEIGNNEGNQQVILAGANNRMYNCHVWSGDQYTPNPNTVGIEIRGDGFQVHGCTLDRNNSWGISINPNPQQNVGSGIIMGNWFYQNGSDIRSLVKSPKIIIEHNSFQQ